MLARSRLTLIRLGALLAILVSVALLSHYLAPQASGFCGTESGCNTLRKSALSRLGPTYWVPLSGVAAYSLLFWLSFSKELRKWTSWMGALGGGLGVGLLAYQVWLQTFCWMCLCVDVLAIGIGALSLFELRGANTSRDPLRGWAWAVLFGLAINGAEVFSRFKADPPLPATLQEKQQDGVVNVFEFVDFQCPHCRRLHPTLAGEVHALGENVYLQRYHYPLSFHPQSLGAAQADLCARDQGQGEAMAELLLTQPLLDGVWLDHAKSLSLNLETFSACLTSEKTEAILESHRALYKSTSSNHLPLTFIGNQRVEGAVDAIVLRAAFERALDPPFQVSLTVFAVGWLAVAAAVAAAGRKRPDVP